MEFRSLHFGWASAVLSLAIGKGIRQNILSGHCLCARVRLPLGDPNLAQACECQSEETGCEEEKYR
jgi:hypothetical protein